MGRTPAVPVEDDTKPTRLKIITTIGYALVAVVLAVIMSGIQGNRAALTALGDEVDRLEDDYLARLDKLENELEAVLAALEDSVESEVARLDESNRSRRNSIADLEVATAANAATLDELRRDLERVLPPGTD